MERIRGSSARRRKLIVLAVGGVALILLISLWALLQSNPQTPASIDTFVTQNEPKIRLDIFASGLKSPTSITATNNQADGRLFVLEQAGRIRIIGSDGKLQPLPFLDISSKVLNSGEMGLLGLAFHPNYVSNGFFYINYINKNQETVIARYHVTSDNNVADSASEKILFQFKQPYVNHNGGDLKFGPDGYLYITLGDGGSAGDPQNRAQDKGVLFGKILRVDVNGGDPYVVPDTNPFVGRTGVRPEIWAYGLRNPWRISFDKTTGDLYIADVGQNKIEELNFQSVDSKGGVNYGWRCFEGSQVFNSQGCLSANNYQAPILEYNHDEGRCSITGGYVYRGSKYPALTGKYFYGDYCGGQLYFAVRTDGKWAQTLALKTTYLISTFGQDSNGELYVADYGAGNIYKIVDAANK